MPGSGGKSTERLVEELAAYSLNAPPLFALHPADAYKQAEGPPPPFSGFTIKSLPPLRGVFNGFFMDSRVHIQLEYAPEGPSPPAANDWHIVDAREDVVALHCFLTGSTVTVRVFPAHITPEIRETFSVRAIRQRTPPGKQAPTPELCWNSFCRVLNDVIILPPSERKAVPAQNPTASVRLDLHTVLPFVGFTYNSATDSFDPPRTTRLTQQQWQRRVLLEGLLGLSTFDQRDALVPALNSFFGLDSPFGDAHLSPREYGCLGATATMADDQIISRYGMQVSNDAANVPWYLEALKQVAQSSQSEALEMKVLELLSLGTQTLSGLEEAFALVGLDVKAQAGLTDEQLVELVVELGSPGPVLDAASALRPASPLISRAAAAPNMGFAQAFRALGLDDPEANDSVVGERARALWDSGPVGKLEARRALEIVGIERRSSRLLYQLEQYIPVTSAAPSLEEAYTRLGVGPDVGDRDIEAIFEANAEDASAVKLLELRRALYTIADSRGSLELRSYLSGGEFEDLTIDQDGSLSPHDRQQQSQQQQQQQQLVQHQHLQSQRALTPAGPRLPVGLWNTGNTCYLNSLLQFYYSLGPVREFVVKYSNSQAVQADDESMAKKKVGGRIVPFNEVKRSEIFVEHLASLFNEIQTTHSAHVTPSELLAYLVLIPPQEDADEIIAANRVRDAQEEAELRIRLVAALQRQQDVTECIENVLYQMEAATCASGYDEEDGEQHDIIKDLFYGTTMQTLQRISDGGNKRTKKERFSSLLVDVSDGPADIYEALDKFFSQDVLDLEDGATLRTLRVTKLPAILQVQVQRVQFDRETFMPYKSLNPIRFEQTVYLDRYLDAPEGSELHEKVEEVKRWRAELEWNLAQIEEKGEMVQERDALATTLAWLETTDAPISTATRRAVESRYAELRDQIASLETRKNELQESIRHQFDGFTKHGYRIHALFIHKGDASYGHYWIYIRDFETGQFYKYNDEFVSKASDEEVFDFREENLATPYFLVFIRDDVFESVRSAALDAAAAVRQRQEEQEEQRKLELELDAEAEQKDDEEHSEPQKSDGPAKDEPPAGLPNNIELIDVTGDDSPRASPDPVEAWRSDSEPVELE